MCNFYGASFDGDNLVISIGQTEAPDYFFKFLIIGKLEDGNFKEVDSSLYYGDSVGLHNYTVPIDSLFTVVSIEIHGGYKEWGDWKDQGVRCKTTTGWSITRPGATTPTSTQPTGTQPTGTQPTGTQPTGTSPVKGWNCVNNSGIKTCEYVDNGSYITEEDCLNVCGATPTGTQPTGTQPSGCSSNQILIAGKCYDKNTVLIAGIGIAAIIVLMR